MRVLLAEDDELFGSAVQKALIGDGYALDWTAKGADLVLAMGAHHYECVLLDLGLPDVGGETLLRGIRRHHPGVRVIVLTARGDPQVRVRLLDIGADDYMIKPVDLDELAARLRAVMRRTRSVDGDQTRIEHGALTLLPSRRTATWRGEPLALTNKEFWLLETLVRRKHQMLTRAQLQEALYGWGEEIASNAIEVYIHFIRRKCDSGLIITVRGGGYQICEAEHCL